MSKKEKVTYVVKTTQEEYTDISRIARRESIGVPAHTPYKVTQEIDIKPNGEMLMLTTVTYEK